MPIAKRLARLLAVAGLCLGAVDKASADPIRVYAAGSMTAAMKELIAASGLPAEAVAQPVFGPAGVLRQRIESGEAADLFASADMAQVQAVADKGPGAPPVPYARNRLCVVSRASLGVTPGNLLDKLLDPTVRVATSTPVADPGGDYTWAMFKRADELKPGAAATLSAKALKLLGTTNAMVPVAGHSPGATVFLSDKADALIYYCSGAAPVLREVPDLTAVTVPDNLDAFPVYGLTVRTDRPDAMRLALFILSEPGQAILARNGLLPVLGHSAAGTKVKP